jgi:hypothetical protein
MTKIALVAALVVASAAPSESARRCGDDAADVQEIAAVRALVSSRCDCAGSATHGRYVTCARRIAAAAVSDHGLRLQCVHEVVESASKSICGRPGRAAACGDGTCDQEETCATCCADCGPCAPSCGNEACEEGETFESCPGDCVPASVPTLPIAVGDCAFEAYRSSGDCNDMPTIQMSVLPVDAACFSSLTTAPSTATELIQYLPSQCCAGTTCGGGVTPSPVHVGDAVNVAQGSATALLGALASCVGQGIVDFVVPLVGCPADCTQIASVTGFARIRLTEVRSTGSPKFIRMAAICGDTCGDGFCTAGETCSSCAGECGGCPTTCE